VLNLNSVSSSDCC